MTKKIKTQPLPTSTIAQHGVAAAAAATAAAATTVGTTAVPLASVQPLPVQYQRGIKTGRLSVAGLGMGNANSCPTTTINSNTRELSHLILIELRQLKNATHRLEKNISDLRQEMNEKFQELDDFMNINADADGDTDTNVNSLCNGTETNYNTNTPTPIITTTTTTTPPSYNYTNNNNTTTIHHGNPNATLFPCPKNLYDLWTEYCTGIDGRLPAKDFTSQQRGAVKYKYTRRKVFWDCINRHVIAGIPANVAIDRVYQCYGHKLAVTTIINLMRKDRKTQGGHPSLRI